MKAKYVNGIKSINNILVFSVVLLFGIIFLALAIKLAQQKIQGSITFIIIGIVVILIGAGGLGYLIYKKNRSGK